MTNIRWGILGCGRIAGNFAEAIQHAPGAVLAAAGSRTIENANKFADRFGIPARYGSYEQLAAAKDVDAIYVATPHPMHSADSILCINHGKAVLTEKPFTINTPQAQAIIDAAHSAGVFVMEAHWTRFLPMMAEVRRIVSAGEIGDLRSVQADFGFRAEFDPAGRLFDLALGGGALLDVGCYCVSLAVMLMGAPDRVNGVAEIGSTGVDEQATMSLGYPDGKIAILSTAVRTNTQQEAVICGTTGRIHIHSPWWKPSAITLIQDGKEKRNLDLPVTGNGFCYQISEVMSCIHSGKLESEIMPHQQTLEIMQIMDELRSQWGVHYPGE